MNYLYKLAESTNIINKKEKWNGINILHHEASRVGALDLGIAPKNILKSKKAKLVYLLGADNFRHEEIPEDAFVIY
jgi:NADH dehydrogenase (ubiquinone) Fe-S protein 1